MKRPWGECQASRRTGRCWDRGPLATPSGDRTRGLPTAYAGDGGSGLGHLLTTLQVALKLLGTGGELAAELLVHALLAGAWAFCSKRLRAAAASVTPWPKSKPAAWAASRIEVHSSAVGSSGGGMLDPVVRVGWGLPLDGGDSRGGVVGPAVEVRPVALAHLETSLFLAENLALPGSEPDEVNHSPQFHKYLWVERWTSDCPLLEI